ncbi:mitochondrial dicarboxylate transporter [Exophiala viscosa]|uniref:mitochondrial dicarboxylate transporter n=1 Tax=Exophiala viscosa TaxID=2486360 RepID=UPI00219F39E9|nr:mitochondrial dicarboxylate transporter [Exophiala viscosa]
MANSKPQKQPFWLGGAAASMAACFTHPLDQTKYRMQVIASRQNMLRTMFQFASRDGITSLWWGISASMLRQSTYSTARFGLYNHFASEARQRTGQQQLSSRVEVACAGAAGGLAGLVGNPTEVALVRMCADGARPPAQRFGYAHAFDALLRIGKEEGIRTFTRGLGPNVVRSIIMNVSQIATYSAAKRELLSNPSLGLKDGMPTHFLASLLAGTVATTACAPADVLKSRVQNAVVVDGVRPSVRRIIVDSFRNEGPRFLMKGWTPAWLRLAPNTVLTFIFIEQLQKLVNLSRDASPAKPLVAAAPVQKA